MKSTMRLAFLSFACLSLAASFEPLYGQSGQRALSPISEDAKLARFAEASMAPAAVVSFRQRMTEAAVKAS